MSTASVAFVFTNPRHHLEMMLPVARELERRGVTCSLVSLAELRGLETPRDVAAIRRAIPLRLRRRNGAAARPAAALTAAEPWSRGRLAKRAVWEVLRLRLRLLLRGARVVVVANDAVYPYIELLGDLHRRGVRSVLMQEGIRFPLPNGYAGPQYGAFVTAAVCAWGDGSRDYFVASHIAERTIRVTGAPRLDDLDLDGWRARGKALLAEHGLESAPIAFLSNPIEIQGYGTKQLKLALFERFLAAAAPVVLARNIPIIVKNHLHEDPAEFAQIAAASPIGHLVKVLPAAPIFAAIAASRAAIVLTSTVGLEALAFGVPIGVLEIPGHGFAFEYVERGAAVPLASADLRAGLEELLDNAPARRAAGAAFVERQLHDRGHASANVATVIQQALAGHARGAP